MKINDIELSYFNAELKDRVAYTQNIKSVIDWLDGATEGVVLHQSYDWRTLALTFLVSCYEDEDKAYKSISELTSQLANCVLKFDDIDLSFPCVLNGSTAPERVQNGVFKVTYLLKNDWGIGENTTLSFDIDNTGNFKEITVNYIENWETTMKGYSVCFDADERLVPLETASVWVNLDAEAEDWNSFFFAAGIDLNKHKKYNDTNGFIYIEDYDFPSFSLDEAKKFLQEHDELNIYYNRVVLEGFVDLPLDTTYPSTVITTGSDNQYFFDLGVGADWDIKDIGIVVYGRFFSINNVSTGNGSLFGSKQESDYKGGMSLTLVVPDAYVYLKDETDARDYEVYDSSTTSGKNFIIETLESIADTPIRKYGLVSESTGTPAADVIFNGVTLDRVPFDNVTLTGNLLVLNGIKGTGRYCDIARVQVYYKEELVRDFVPIDTHVKNGFINTYDVGLYDMVTMTYLPWSKTDGTSGNTPDDTTTIPDTPDNPTPDIPDPEPTVEPNLLIYYGTSYIDSETTMGENALTWTTGAYDTGTEPTALSTDLIIAYSVPNYKGTLTLSYYSSSYYTLKAAGTDKWGRALWQMDVTSSKSRTGQYIIVKDKATGEELYTKNFAIASF